jgi:hypothetical protein
VNLYDLIEEDLGTDVDNGILDNFNLLKNRVVRKYDQCFSGTFTNR